MEKHTCKLCFRRFSNGRALGGHMRSHVINPGFVASSAPPIRSSYSSSTSTSEDEAEEEKSICYGLRENPRKSFRVADPEFAAADDGLVVQDRESETELPWKAASRRRTRRVLWSSADPPPISTAVAETEPASSVSDTTPEEDVALSLMMLSRDVWRMKPDRSESEDSDGGPPEPRRRSVAAAGKGRTRFQCGTCKKVFKSYQALGGHRASHKKAKGGCAARTDEDDGVGPSDAAVSADRTAVVHQCPVCFRVFASGQALGGHKRSHAIIAPPTVEVITAEAASNDKLGERLIDLNLPAPMEEDDFSQVELSALSEAEFVNQIE
ncbi:Zinc finger protein ZAT9 [Acorus calamus]|uniref:Zinc finger protein ZAT9 n=1 Tax=Acorus calamus TaxID=4465 RepID=A0AAV9C9U5_ACOCL|nr:Zinc finger protein ZAT9 [Acorus calamus]